MKRTIIIILAVFLTFPVFAERISMPQVIMPTAASNGFGGHHVAYTDNVFSLLVNPAAMIQVQQRSFFTLAPTIFNPQSTFKLFSGLSSMVSDGNFSDMGGILDTLSDQKGKLALGMELREFPFSIAWVANGFGFGLWNRTFINLNIKQTYVEAYVLEDVMLPVGFAFKVFEVGAHNIDGGITLKPFARAMANTELSILSISNSDDDLLDDINAPLIVGGTFDLGFLYRWNVGLSAGLTFDDIFSYGKEVMDFNSDNNNSSGDNTYYIPFTMNMGVAYDFKVGTFWEGAPKFLADTGFTLAADWRNVFNIFNQDDYLDHYNYLLDFGVGLKVCLFDILNVRVGMNEMLPAVGVGLDLGPIEIDLAYYGKEFGFEPGQLSTAVLEFSFSVRPEAKKRYWPWTNQSIVGIISGKDD
jgi:hypothetical protein